ncbi:MAG: tryptophan--tRNA ligase [Alphaproteobacteria bacterium]
MIYQPYSKRRIFSGIQPTGGLTLGNYLGAIRNWVKLQNDFECLFCLVDQHALTIDKKKDAASIADQCYDMAAALLACGIDPDKHILFVQSHNSHHVELGWYFTCIARMGWLNRMTQYKDKAGKNKEQASTGLFTYPNLMAADILAYRATHVPVGDDQKQHLELARDIANKFNNDWDVPDFFPVTEPLIFDEGARIMSLRDGTKKMSKSDPSDMSRLNLSDDADLIAQKIRKAKTDSLPLPDSMDALENRAEAKNLLTIYGCLAGLSFQQTLDHFQGQSFSYLKQQLVDCAIANLAPLTKRYNEFLDDKGALDMILKQGASRARALSTPVLHDVRQIMGLMPHMD